MLLADYQAYVDCQQRVSDAYRDQTTWTRTSILNCARVGRFSSDRSIRDYCRDIWNVIPIAPRAELSMPRLLSTAVSTRVVQAARARRSARPCSPAASTSACFRRTPHKSSCCCSMTPLRRSRSRIIPLAANGAPDLSLLACVRAGPRAGPDLRATARMDRSRRNVDFGSMPGRSSSIRTDSPSRFPPTTIALPRRRPGANAAVAMKSVVADSRPLRLGRRPAAQTALRRNDHLRASRARLHATCELRRRGQRRAGHTPD